MADNPPSHKASADKKKEIVMNTYKKTMIMLGILLALVPHLCRALDAKGDSLANNIKIMYGTTISTSNISNPNKNFGEWDSFIRNSVYPYVVENSSIAGIKDTLLMNSLTQLINNSAKLTAQLSTVRAGILQKGENQVHELMLQKCIDDLNSIKNSINATSVKLRQEKYYVASKQNAKEILLLALDRILQTAEKSVELLTTELQNRKK